MSIRNRSFATAVLSAAVVLPLAAPAMAATVYHGNDRATSGGSSVSVRDGETDGRSVYSHYTRRDDVQRRIETFGGNGTVATTGSNSSNPVSRCNVCENVSGLPDPCSSSVRP